MTTSCRQFTALCLDFDGTLVDTEHLKADAYFQAFQIILGVKVDSVDDGWQGHPENTVVAYMAAAVDHKTVAAAVKRADDIITLKRRLYQETIDCGIPFVAGAGVLLDRLRDAGIPCALVTSSPRDEALRVLSYNGYAEHFAFIVGRDEVIRNKPAPDPYLRAIEELGVSSDHSLAVEDSLPGLQSAHAAGLSCVGLGMETSIHPTDYSFPSLSSFLESTVLAKNGTFSIK